MEYFKVICPVQGIVSLDGSEQGENVDGNGFCVLQCDSGEHEISLACSEDKRCQEESVLVLIAGTNPVKPKEITFTCGA